MKPKLSLIICSKNRAEKLEKCLASINADEMLEVKGELILVNNDSTDDTIGVMQTFKEKSPFPITIVNEPKTGKGHALNTGISEASGDLLVFTDDDCYLAEGYLKKASEIFKSCNFQYCGGRAIIYDKTDAMYAVPYLGDKQVILPPYDIIWPGKISGSNMIIHRRVVNKIGLFDPLFGAGTPFAGEDVDYATRASLAGFTGAYVPDLIVYHHHGRKPGPDTENLIRYYAHGTGAYFTKFILRGELIALKHWIHSFMSVRRFTPLKDLIQKDSFIKTPYLLFILEICGGAHYLFVRIKETLVQKFFKN